jgi:hypothetical protein
MADSPLRVAAAAALRLPALFTPSSSATTQPAASAHAIFTLSVQCASLLHTAPSVSAAAAPVC